MCVVPLVLLCIPIPGSTFQGTAFGNIYYPATCFEALLREGNSMDLRFQIQLQQSRIAVFMLHSSDAAQGSTQDFLTGGPCKCLPKQLTEFVYEKKQSLTLAFLHKYLRGTTSLGFILSSLKKNIEIQIKQSLKLPLK